MKLFIITPVAYGFWNYPTYSLLAIVALLFVVQVIGELMSFKPPANDNYEEIKQLFNQIDEITFKDIYLEDREKETSTKLEVVPVNISLFSYRELQAIAKSLNISGRNRKRIVLEQELLAVCK